MRLGPIHEATLVVRNLERALAAYVGQLGLIVAAGGRLQRQRGLDMGDAALVDARCAYLRNTVDSVPWLTLIEAPDAAPSSAYARRGWVALGLAVRDVDALAARLDREIWRVRCEPTDAGDGTRALHLVGADGEVLHLLQGAARCPVDRIVAATLAARDGNAALGFYAGLGLVQRWPPGATPAVCPPLRGELRGGHRIEIEQWPSLPAADATLRSGIRMIGFARSNAIGRRLAACNDPSARILAGPEGEAIELI